jgi:hypothetical protein
MKVVINACYGGFGLSQEGIEEYARLAGFKLYSYVEDRRMENGIKPYVSDPKKQDKWEIVYHYKSPVTSLVDEDRDYFSCRDIERTDPILVRVVEELGDKANGSCASLRVIQIPDGVEFYIDEYDGFEHVAEKHRTWS